MYVHAQIKKDCVARDIFLKDHSEKKALAELIDHTLLKADSKRAEFELLCQQALENRFRAVCLPSSQIKLASSIFSQSNLNDLPRICTVIGFPLGHNSTESKVSEIQLSKTHGANEFDYVQNIGWVRDGLWQKLTDESASLVHAAQGDVVKVILETSLLNEEEIFNSALAAARGGVHVLKTSTGFGSRGATIEDLAILSRVVEKIKTETGLTIGVKASGGVKSFADALKLIQAGATRLGTSSGVNLILGRPSDANTSY